MISKSFHSSKKPVNKNNTWQLQEAKAKLSQLIADAIDDGYQIITKNGKSVAVVLSKEEFESLNCPKKSLLDFFKDSPCPDVEID